MDLMIYVEDGEVKQVIPKEVDALAWVRAKQAENEGNAHYKYHSFSQTYALPGEYGWLYVENPPDVVKLAVFLAL